TWYWNRYPGARCDVPSIEYSFGFSPELEQDWHWPEVFSAQPDILAYANHITERFDLRRDIQFNTRVSAVEYQDEQNLWRLTTETGEILSAKYCVMATGCLSVPNRPHIDGEETFKGRTLHTGLWPKEQVDLTGLRVGVIGTGSSGVQAIPELAKQAGHLTVFQRTPVYTVPANRKAMRSEIEATFKENYADIREMQQKNIGGVSNFSPSRINSSETTSSDKRNEKASEPRSVPTIMTLGKKAIQSLIDERGLGVLLGFRDLLTDPGANEIANELYRENVLRQVKDKDTAEHLLTEEFGFGCKRQVLDRDYYETYNRDNVSLVDVRNSAIQCITETGIETSTGHTELDVLVYATGFDAMTGALTRANITGRQGKPLTDKWVSGPVTYLGLQMQGFPNLFTVTGPGSPSVLCNMLVAIEQHVNWIADCITHLRDKHIDTIEPLASSESDWIQHVNEVSEGTMYTAPNCNSWYLGANIEGKTRIFMPYVGGYPRYKTKCDEEAEAGYPGFQCTSS
ncbi:MAG: NAD(P)/FAD-dependent oxidoreductase, partial [Pseudomonadales bacterium]|nr:NAD(P)/FAD-dependent oxidoreductase [Pseudomonadales bacterium]